MKRFCLVLSILVILPCMGWAGEKEDAQRDIALLQERIGRLQAEFEVARRDMIFAQQKLQDITKKEQETKKPPEKKDGGTK